MTEFLVRHFVKDYENTSKVSVRTAYGVLASVTGIFCNILLFAAKWLIGYLLHSISVMADAFNNLSDAGSSIISLIGVKMAGKPADKEHPFGHGRIEYIAALIVAFLVMEVGFTFFKSAIAKIREPEELYFQAVSMLILLIGAPVDPQIYKQISDFVEKYDGILGSHDLIVHNYGPGRSMASIHAEVPNDVNIETSHEIIDRVEREALEQLGIMLVIHMDPVETKDEHVLEAKEKVEKVLRAMDPKLSIHDFRMVPGTDQINLIFDLVVPFEYDQKKQDHIRSAIMGVLQIVDPRYQCVITVERSYVASAKEGV